MFFHNLLFLDQVNAYDTVRVVDVLYRHKYFLTPMSDFHLCVVQPSSTKTIKKSDHTCELYELEVCKLYNATLFNIFEISYNFEMGLALSDAA